MIQVFVRRFNTQQVAVGAGLAKSPVFVIAAFTDAERDRHIKFFDLRNDAAHYFGGVIHIFAGLHNHRLKPHGSRFACRFNKFFRLHTVTAHFFVMPADTAVHTVITANVGKFYQAAQMDIIAHMATANIVCTLKQLRLIFLV